MTGYEIIFFIWLTLLTIGYSLPDDVKNQIYLCAGLIDDLTDK